MHLAISETIRYRATKLGDVIATSITLIIQTCKQFGKQCSSCKTTINSLRPYIMIGT